MSAALFDEDAVLAEARAFDGLDEFGDEVFREPLRALLASLARAPLHALGARILHGGVVRSLTNRLRIEHWFRRHPEIRDERIEAPWVVVGMMRSGTTLMQRLLASDPRHATTLGWEALEPAPRLTRDATRPDPRIAAGEAREKQARAFTPGIFAIHPSHAHEAEEEIMFLADAFLSHVPEASCDVPAYRAWLDEQDFRPAYRHLRRTLQLLQWQKKKRGEPCLRWVLKTPAHLGYLDLLFETFPGAHVIHLHRDPLETIPSGASLNTALWRLHADRVDPAKVGRQWIERMAWTTRRALAVRAGMRDESRRFTDVRFRDAVSDPLGEARRVYAAAGVELDDDARAAMDAWLARDAREKLPKHRYAARDFGLSDDAIRAQFSEYTVRFFTA
jgi:hypothetical protein